jgi:transglutaminase-like putative cysteine protease
MKPFKLLFTTLLIILSGCRTSSDFSQVLEDIQENLDFGNISSVIQSVDSLKKYSGRNDEIIHIADSIKQIAERISLDFSVTEKEVNSQIKKLYGPFSSEEKDVWENKGWLEWRKIDGEKKYFKRAASNLILLKKFYEHRDERLMEIANEPGMIFRLNHTEEVLKRSDKQSNPVVPATMKIIYTISVHPDAVPEGEQIRCWLPWPKENHMRQQEVKLLSTSCQKFLIAPDTATHRTIYMEELSKKGLPTVFQISFSYVSFAQHYNMAEIKTPPYDKTSDIYNKYTSEQLPHICFSDDVKQLTDSLTANDNNPASVVRKIYLWFKGNITWTGALEYSIIPNISEYVLKNHRGDCGMQTFLFMSMLRYKGIPVRWQSGWMMPPGNENLHDWCEVYFEGTGWVPVDVSYDLQKSENTLVRDFYLSGIDSYRLILNDGIAGPLYPEKHFLRSEPYDFQRGEVEWKGGNLYFDKWDYDMKIEYLK